MTLFVYVGGVDVSNSIRLEDGIQQMTQAADGSYAMSGFKVDDPTGSMTFLQLAPVVVVETACSQPRSFTGIVTQAVATRWEFKTGAGRIWTIDVADLNELLHRRVLRGSGAKRPAETGTARLAWLLTTAGMTGVVYDNGLITANAWLYDEADYRGQYADDVLSSIISASAVNRWIFFVYWDASAMQPSLYYGDVSAAAHTSTLSLSNVLSDVLAAPTTVFPPWPDAELLQAGDEIYDGVYVDYDTGKLYLQRASTFTTFGVHRDGVMESTRINNATTALRHANTFLDVHADKTDTITCTVTLPAAQINLIEAGHRVAIRFSHFPGYTTSTYSRVTRRTFLFTPGTNATYDLHLELSLRGVNQTGGGDPGGFPLPPAATAVVQTGCGFALGSTVPVVFPNPVSEGHMLVAWLVSRGGSTAISPPAGWTTIQAVQIGGASTGGNPDSPAAMYYKVADSGDDGLTGFSFISANGSSRPKILGWELSGVGDPTAHVSVTNGSGTSFSLPSLSVGNGIVIVGIGIGSDTPSGSTITPSDHLYTEGGDGFWQTAFGADDATTTGAIAYAITFGVSGGSSDHDGVAAFFPSDASTNPPAPGQWVYDDIPTPAPGGGTRLFTTSFPYASGSLRVWVDQVEQTAAVTETDPSAGTFTLAFDPRSWEVAKATYQGI